MIDYEKTEKDLREIIRAVARDIEAHAFDALWCRDQYITGGKITIDISPEMIPEIRYERKVFPRERITRTTDKG